MDLILQGKQNYFKFIFRVFIQCFFAWKFLFAFTKPFLALSAPPKKKNGFLFNLLFATPLSLFSVIYSHEEEERCQNVP